MGAELPKVRFDENGWDYSQGDVPADLNSIPGQIGIERLPVTSDDHFAEHVRRFTESARGQEILKNAMIHGQSLVFRQTTEGLVVDIGPHLGTEWNKRKHSRALLINGILPD